MRKSIHLLLFSGILTQIALFSFSLFSQDSKRRYFKLVLDSTVFPL